jgi:hypothetical protein
MCLLSSGEGVLKHKRPFNLENKHKIGECIFKKLKLNINLELKDMKKQICK